jgi:hypothetical protein
MRDIDEFDPALFGVWPKRQVYGQLDEQTAEGWSDEAIRRQVSAVFLERKSADVQPEELRLLLNDMTREMREQFDHFRKLRSTAEALCGPDADEAAAKLARSDIKASTDAMSLIIRTLEKVDALQRQLSRDRELEAERNADSLGYEERKEHLMQLIERKVTERVKAILGKGSGAASRREATIEEETGSQQQTVATGPPVGQATSQ